MGRSGGRPRLVRRPTSPAPSAPSPKAPARQGPPPPSRRGLHSGGRQVSSPALATCARRSAGEGWRERGDSAATQLGSLCWGGRRPEHLRTPGLSGCRARPARRRGQDRSPAASRPGCRGGQGGGGLGGGSPRLAPPRSGAGSSTASPPPPHPEVARPPAPPRRAAYQEPQAQRPLPPAPAALRPPPALRSPRRGSVPTWTCCLAVPTLSLPGGPRSGSCTESRRRSGGLGMLRSQGWLWARVGSVCTREAAATLGKVDRRGEQAPRRAAVAGRRPGGPEEHGHPAGFTVRAPGEDRGAEAAGCPHRRAGAGVGSEGRTDPEAAE